MECGLLESSYKWIDWHFSPIHTGGRTTHMVICVSMLTVALSLFLYHQHYNVEDNIEFRGKSVVGKRHGHIVTGRVLRSHGPRVTKDSWGDARN